MPTLQSHVPFPGSIKAWRHTLHPFLSIDGQAYKLSAICPEGHQGQLYVALHRSLQAVHSSAQVCLPLRLDCLQAEEVTSQAFQAATPDPLRHDAAPLVHMFNTERLEDVLRIGSLAAQQVRAAMYCTLWLLRQMLVCNVRATVLRSFCCIEQCLKGCCEILGTLHETLRLRAIQDFEFQSPSHGHHDM